MACNLYLVTSATFHYLCHDSGRIDYQRIVSLAFPTRAK
uniref:Uncharacterized protein n=1 Tax=Anguilla anguilla TaxID=7936 RepID=A0A0E9Q8R0_ANGAN